jgi:hypothetical protein
MAKAKEAVFFEASAYRDIPEKPDLSFTTTDLQGGDSGHGGKAELTLSSENGNFTIIIEAGGKKLFELPPYDFENFVVRIVARGDFEIEGLAETLVELGLKTWSLVHERKIADQQRIAARE